MNTETLYNLHKPSLFSLAYRMLGSVMDAEDIVQEAFIAYDQLPDSSSIQNERAFLHRIVTNRCLDLLRSSARKRELYVGPWLPEPLITDGVSEADPSALYLQKESLSTAYLLLLQQLNAVERAVFLLREIFSYSYDEISEIIGKSSANCRQIFHRAKQSIEFEPVQTPAISVAEQHIKDFVNAVMQGNKKRLLELVNEQVVFYSDGGGKVRAAQVPITGSEQVLKFLQNLLVMYEGRYSLSHIYVNGMPGVRLDIDDSLPYIFSFDYRDHRIQSIYALANPDKLRHL